MFTLSEESIQQYLSGMSAKTLAVSLGVDTGTVQRALYRQNVHKNKVAHPKFIVPQEGIDRYLAGESSIAIAKLYGVTCYTIRTSLARQGIPVRGYEAALKSGFMSRAQSAYHQGIPFTEWEEFKVAQTHRIMHTREWRDWRQAVYQRDSYTCQMCGDNKGGNLQPHHIYKKAKYPERIFDVINGITLCEPCHDSVSGKEDQYIEMFLTLLSEKVTDSGE